MSSEMLVGRDLSTVASEQRGKPIVSRVGGGTFAQSCPTQWAGCCRMRAAEKEAYREGRTP